MGPALNFSDHVESGLGTEHLAVDQIATKPPAPLMSAHPGSSVSRCSSTTCFGDCRWSPHTWPEAFTKQEQLEREILDILPFKSAFQLQETGSWYEDY